MGYEWTKYAKKLVADKEMYSMLYQLCLGPIRASLLKFTSHLPVNKVIKVHKIKLAPTLPAATSVIIFQ